jgi:tRNA G18 (ribose-2'-O)-methylase SpoU
MITITDANDARIIEFISIRDHVLNSRNLIVAESEKIFLQYKSISKPIFKILCTNEFALRHQLSGENVFIADKKILECIAGFKIHFEVLFLAQKPEDSKLLELDDKIILLNGLTSPENVGSIVRSSAAFEINSIIVDDKTCSPFLRRCIRVSMGNVFSMKTYRSINLRRDIAQLKDAGYTIIGTANIANSHNLVDYIFPKKCVLIIGSEGNGMDLELINICDIILRISINQQVAHLNAANAATVFLSHMSQI